MNSMPVFNWEVAVKEDRNLQLMNTFVQSTITKLPGQPAPRADSGRGSRYAPAPAPPVKPDTTMLSSNGTKESSSQFIDPRDYQSESSSEYDMREVDPMDDLSDFETDASQQLKKQLQQVQKEQEMESPMEDVEMDASPQQQDQTVCEVCKSSERESEIVLCDDCDAEYHIFCLEPPLARVPENQWYCPSCSRSHSEPEKSETTAEVKAEQLGVASTNAEENVEKDQTSTEAMDTAVSSDNAVTNAMKENDPTSIPVAQALEGDPEKSNLLLIHACNCDDVKCIDPEFQVFCPHMKRFLRSVCWASHSDKWRSYRLARVTADLFAYHAMHCVLGECNVPLCVKIREEEIV